MLDDTTLHCERHGWHPRIQEVLDRLEQLTGVRADLVYRQVLIDEVDAQEAPGHLLGPVAVAVEVLRAREAQELAQSFRLSSAE
jgi:predicted N-acetyltransferase YhbS